MCGRAISTEFCLRAGTPFSRKFRYFLLFWPKLMKELNIKQLRAKDWTFFYDFFQCTRFSFYCRIPFSWNDSALCVYYVVLFFFFCRCNYWHLCGLGFTHTERKGLDFIGFLTQIISNPSTLLVFVSSSFFDTETHLEVITIAALITAHTRENI